MEFNLMGRPRQRVNLKRQESLPGEGVRKEKTLDDVYDIHSEHQSGNLPLRDLEDGEFSLRGESKVIVVKNDETKTVDAKELKDILLHDTNIKQIIIEEINVDNAKRFRVLYNQNVNDPLPIEKKPDEDLSVKKLTQTIKWLGFEEKMNRFEKNESEEEQPVVPNESVLKFSLKKEEDQPRVRLSLKSEDLKFKGNDPRRLYGPQNSLEEKNELPLLKQVEISKHVLTKKDKLSKSVITSTYYKVKKHLELFKLGQTFLEDYKIGVKSFAFNNVLIPKDQENAILGLACFFANHAQITPTIVLDEFEGSLYQKFLGNPVKSHRYIQGENFGYTQLVGDGCIFLEFSELEKIKNRLETVSYESFLTSIVSGSDLVIWDLPTLNKMNLFSEIFFPVIQAVESISFVVKQDLTRYEELNALEEYFSKYGINIKGIIMGYRH